MKIGFFDSGIGGITVLKEALDMLPCEDYIYFADTLHVPYGEKSKEEVKRHIFEAVEFIIQRGIKALVIACNTATSIAVSDLREIYTFPIIGMEPAVKPAITSNNSNGKRVLVCATPLTLKETKFKDLVERLDKNNIVDCLPLPELVRYAESLVFDEEIIIPYLKDRLSDFDLAQYGTVVLGCTHFPYFKGSFRKIFKNADIIDGASGTVRRLKNILDENGLAGGGKGSVEFYSSGEIQSDRMRFIKGLAYLA